MKKKLFGAIAFVAIAVAAGWNVQQNNNKVEMSEHWKTLRLWPQGRVLKSFAKTVFL